MALILASKSPRRRELLQKAGMEFAVKTAEVNESCQKWEPAANYVERLARDKALAVAQFAASRDLVLGADTAVVVAGQILGKPKGAADAARMLRLLSGGTHYVVTGFCIVRAPSEVVALRHASSTVVFKPLTAGDIQSYVATGEPLDKAGAYAIQGFASKFVQRVEGSLENVIGLPLAEVVELLRSLEGENR